MTACYTRVSPTGGASGLSQVAVHLHGNVGKVKGDGYCQMANDSIIRALKTKSKSLNLSSRKIIDLPEVFARLTWIVILKLNNNNLSSLPSELVCLQKVSSDTSVQ